MADTYEELPVKLEDTKPHKALVVDIVDGFGQTGELEKIPFIHVSGPMPDYICNGRLKFVAIADRRPLQDAAVLRCKRCSLELLINSYNRLSFELAHVLALASFAGRSEAPAYTRHFFCEVGGLGLGMVQIRGLAEPSRPPTEVFLEAQDTVIELLSVANNRLPDIAQKIQKTKTFFANKGLAKAAVMVTNLLQFLEHPTKGMPDTHYEKS